MLIPITEKYINKILPWRNQLQVRKFSFNEQIISLEQHLAWWQQTKKDKTKQWLIFKYEKLDAGVVYFSDIIPKKEAEWGFYFSTEFEDYQKLKLWFTLETQAIEYAFNELRLNSLKCEVLAFNKAALVMHKRFGFKQINKYKHSRGEVIVLELKNNYGLEKNGK